MKKNWLDIVFDLCVLVNLINALILYVFRIIFKENSTINRVKYKCIKSH